jgi:hypothetical protein
MLTVGVILISIMAIFFVLLAYLIASLEVRSVLTAVASFAVFAVSWFLYRRKLVGTAEGIAVLAIVLFLLDIWIIRANNLFATSDVDGWLYAGIGTGALAMVLTLVFRGLPLRSISASAVVLAPFAALAVTLGVLTNADGPVRVWAAFTAVGLITLLWRRLPFGAPERGLFRAFGFIALAFAILPAAFTFVEWDAGPAASLIVVACVWFAHLLLSPHSPTRASTDGQPSAPPVPQTHTAMQVLAALGLGLSVAGMAPALWLRLPDISTSLWVPATVAMSGAILLALLSRARRLSTRAGLLLVATAVPVAVSALAIAPAVVLAFSGFEKVVRVQPFRLTVMNNIPGAVPRAGWTTALAVLGFSLLVAVLLRILNQVRRFGWIPVAFASVGLIATCFTIATPVVTAVGFLFLAAAGLVSAASSRLPRVYRSVGAVTGAVSTLALFLVGTTNTVTFPFAALAVLAVLIAFREIVRGTTRPQFSRLVTPFVVAALLAALLVSVRLVPAWMQAVTGVTAAHTGPPLLAGLCGLAVLVAVLVTRFLTRPEAAVAASVSVLYVLAGIAELAPRVPVDAGPFLILSVLSAGVAVAWQFPRAVALWPERFVGAAAAPVLAVVSAGVAWDQLDQPGTIVATSALTVVLAAAALLLFRPSESERPVFDVAQHPSSHPARIARLAWDASIALAAAPAAFWAVLGADLGWAALLLLAVTSLLIASGAGGPIRGRTARHHVAWAALPLAVAALWIALSQNDVSLVELYTLPVAGILVVVLALVLVRRPSLPVGSSRTTLLSAALAVAVAPSAVAASPDEPLRGVLVVTGSALLLLSAPFLPRAVRGTQVAATVFIAGMTGAVTAVTVLTLRGAPDGWHNEVVAATLLVTGMLWLRRVRAPRALGTTAVALSSGVIALPLTSALVTEEVTLWRVLVALAFCMTLFVVGSGRNMPSSLIRWTALGSALLLGVTAIFSGVADPFEWATVPLAAGLIVAGALRLATDPAERSWPHLGTGVLLLLVPSLLVDFTGTELWRVVALGVVALGVFGAGLALKLGAPTITGAVVIVIHALAQLWPWISGLYGAIPWWLWAGIGGVVLIVFAATYEKRIRDLRSVAISIRSLR